MRTPDRAAALWLVALLGCGGATPAPVTVAPAAVAPDTTRRAPVAPPEPLKFPLKEPILPPQQAFMAGMMPLRSTGADTFRAQRPTFDGRGVIIGILDSGVDPGLPGFRFTSTGETKLLDLRDFSGEGRIDLHAVTPSPDGAVGVNEKSLTGFGRVARLAAPPYYGGMLRELPLGRAPAADLNVNGRNTDSFPVIVAKSTTGWFSVTDTDGDGSLENEAPIYDYAVSGQLFSYARGATKNGARAMSLAVNFAEESGRPVLDFFFDNSGHGSHVAGIAAGRGMFGIEGFDGVAPGAHLLALKISNNARGGISVTGSMLRAMNYAADFAVRRGMPLVLNMSFGVGNENEGHAAMDSLVNEFALKHPGVVFVISAGNDGPGLSTLGFPGSASLAISACALFPGVFAQPPDAETPVPPDVMGWWSARGGELAKPDICAPGVAYSNVPPWHVGEEIIGGTSMAAPHVSGLAALLQSALVQQGGRAARAVDLKGALVATASPLPGTTPIDQGTGVPNVGAAYRWLVSAHQAGVYEVRAHADGGNQSTGSAAYRRGGLASDADTVQQFTIGSVGGQPAARLLLKSDVPWIRTPASVEFHGGPETVTLVYDAAQLTRPGLHVGTVWARSATDTLGGPLLWLTNTIIVPSPMDQPLRVRETLPAGRLARYFVNLDAASGGLTAHLSVPGDRTSATLYVFEPDGKPHRGGGSAEAGEDSTNVTLRVHGNDVVPGVYEVAVLAPPNGPSRFTLDLGVPRVAVFPGDSPRQLMVKNLGTAETSTTVRFDLAGAARDTLLTGSGSRPARLKVETPAWADRLVVDVSFDPQLWNSVTDFGLSVFDAAGQLISEGPMNYAFTRQVVKLDEAHRGVALEIELFPAFAHFTPPATWTSRLRVAFLAPAPFQLPANGAPIALAPGGSAPIAPPDLVSPLAAPEGYRPLLRTTAKPADGVPAVRQDPW